MVTLKTLTYSSCDRNPSPFLSASRNAENELLKLKSNFANSLISFQKIASIIFWFFYFVLNFNTLTTNIFARKVNNV